MGTSEAHGGRDRPAERVPGSKLKVLVVAPARQAAAAEHRARVPVARRHGDGVGARQAPCGTEVSGRFWKTGPAPRKERASVVVVVCACGQMEGVSGPCRLGCEPDSKARPESNKSHWQGHANRLRRGTGAT